jgi:anti-anti-sigma factor
MQGSGPVVVLSGEADLTSAGQLRELLASETQRAGRRLTVDVSDLCFVDSTALSVFLVTAKMLRERDGELVLMHPQKLVAEVLGLLGADKVIRVISAPEASSSSQAESR